MTDNFYSSFINTSNSDDLICTMCCENPCDHEGICEDCKKEGITKAVNISPILEVLMCPECKDPIGHRSGCSKQYEDDEEF